MLEIRIGGSLLLFWLVMLMTCYDDDDDGGGGGDSLVHLLFGDYLLAVYSTNWVEERYNWGSSLFFL